LELLLADFKIRFNIERIADPGDVLFIIAQDPVRDQDVVAVAISNIEPVFLVRQSVKFTEFSSNLQLESSKLGSTTIFPSKVLVSDKRIELSLIR
jgi:hypothetical protein